MRLIIVCLIVLAMPRVSPACLFCETLASTLSDDIHDASACVIAQLEANTSRQDEAIGMQLARFKVTKVLKGDASRLRHVDAFILPEEPPQGRVLLFAFGEPDAIQWLAPLPLSDIALKYLGGLQTAPKQGSDRLAYFLPYLVAADRHVADDAYNEFARAPYQQITELGDRLDRMWVVEHLQAYLADDLTPPHRIRLMWTLLSVCGEKEDALLFEQLAQDKDCDKANVGFDAALGCYLSLVGAEGLQRVKQDFITSDDEQDVLSAINAIRFHAVETKRFDSAELAAALHPMLRSAQLAASVIPDLARLEDWSVGPRLLELYAQQDAAGIRMHIVNFVRACPKPEATAWLDHCRKLDPEAVRRSETMFRQIGNQPKEPSDVNRDR